MNAFGTKEISEIYRYHSLLNVLRLLIAGIVVVECVGDTVTCLSWFSFSFPCLFNIFLLIFVTDEDMYEVKTLASKVVFQFKSNLNVFKGVVITMEYSKDQIPFLDVLIKRNENGIWMDLYHKPTEIQRYILFLSSNLSNCKWNIAFCLARRICTIAENNAEKLKTFENLKSNLSKYNHLDSLIKQRFQKALSIP